MASGGTPIRRIREVRYPDAQAAFVALTRGEITLLDHVPPERLPEIAKHPGLKGRRFASPSVHRIALDGRNPALRNRKLRRALSLAIDRRGLLEDVVLRRPLDEGNRVSDGPFVQGSFVDAPGVQPLDYNPLLARGLVGAARKDLGGEPIRLTLEYPSSPEAMAVCPQDCGGIQADRAGGPAHRAARGGPGGGPPVGSPVRPGLPGLAADHAPPGRRAAAGPGIRRHPLGRRPGLASPRILQLLIQLDRTPETTAARELAIQIDRESRDELPVVPLWQLEDHYAWRTSLRGPLETADRPYQGVAGWEAEPWIAARIEMTVLALSLFLGGGPRDRRAGPAEGGADRSEALRDPAHVAFDPATRVDAARRSAVVAEWMALVRRFVGDPWAIEVVMGKDPLSALPIESVKADAAEGAGRIGRQGLGDPGPSLGQGIASKAESWTPRRAGWARSTAARSSTRSTLRAGCSCSRSRSSPRRPTSASRRPAASRSWSGAGSLPAASPVGEVAPVGSMFRAIRIFQKPEGSTQEVREVPYSYFRVQRLDGPVVHCQIIRGVGDPLTNRYARKNKLVALGIKPASAPTRLRFLLKGDRQPATGYRLIARTIPPGQKPIEVGTTDREGRIVLPAGFASGLVVPPPDGRQRASR